MRYHWILCVLLAVACFTSNGFAAGTTNPSITPSTNPSVDPSLRASTPSPRMHEDRIAGSPVLQWSDGKVAVTHQLYIGNDADAVAAATPASPEFKGELKQPKFATSGLISTSPYFWRVDEVAADKTVTKGDVWSFRLAHLAFPGAEGYGRFAQGGRGGRIIEVTNLDDSGPGSLREAVEAQGPRTVIFRVGGAITLKSKLLIRNPYITIAGQTAPGDGIATYGWTFGCYAVHDVIMRYVRVRIGDATGVTLDGTGMGVSTDQSIMDHCSVAWSIDEAFSSRSGRNFTLQRCIIAEPLNMSVHAHYVGTGKGHSFAASISGNIGSFHHNLLADCAGRNWSLAGGLTHAGKYDGYCDIRNNVVYNWAHRTNDGGVKALNLVANYYIPGPASRVFHIIMPDAGKPEDPQQYYVADNEMEGYPQYNPDNWANGAVKVDADKVAQIKLDQPFCPSFVKTESAQDAYKSVIADVGANFPHYDPIDDRTVKDVVRRGFTFKGSKTGMPGIIDSQTDVGGYPEMKGGTPPIDSDHDGMPDDWEKSHGLNPADPSDGNKEAADGYTNLEHYLNELPRTAK